MNIRSNITLWPSGRTCAFLAAGLTILSTVIRLWHPLIIQWDLPYPFQPALAHFSFVSRLTLMRSMRPDLESTLQMLIAQMGLLLLVLVFGVAVDATALWMAGRRQQRVAPVGSRLCRCAVATYVAAMMLTLALGACASQFLLANRWILEVPTAALALAFGCLAWATRSATSARQRWAQLGMLSETAMGILSIARSVGQYWHWFEPLRSLATLPYFVDAALHAAAWAAIGVWLGQTQVAPEGASDRLPGFSRDYAENLGENAP
jgi:hypothetical protein